MSTTGEKATDNPSEESESATSSRYLVVALIAAVIAVFAIVAARHGSDSSAQSTDEAAVTYAVQTVVTAANTGDKKTLADRTCGDVGLRMTAGDRQVVVAGRKAADPDASVPVITVRDFHYTTITGDVATTYGRVLGKLGAAAGAEKIAYFALARTGDTWKLCTAEIR
ncbi:hypothetical protein GPX89_05795 [Nocardia sp. ET3-3]|uniref:DUF4878 domain-containing protein n=1 Tax=Nocardia terrae TaxID=2675851 RepID=A0A7K1URI0_9NOCA|nr:hypothetical protein [Nocardia terrae]MVU76759.1 hypothetical protein [Nocardia terrae]